MQTVWSRLAHHRALIGLAILYLIVGVVYALITPLFEKPDEHGHYGYLLYLREHRTLPPFIPLAERPSIAFKQADQTFTRFELAWELHQPPLYYVVTALLTGWLPDEPDPDQFFDRNPYVGSAAPGDRNDNRNYFLHPPTMTPLVLAARLISLLFGLATLLTSYFLAAQLLARHSLVPIATAAIVGFQPTFLFMATAINNDAATAFFGALTVALLMHRLHKGESRYFAILLGASLGLSAITKVSGLVFVPLAGVALLFIHRGFRPAFFRDGLIVLTVALAVGGWWYARNAWLYGDPTIMGAHPAPGTGILSWSRLRHDLLSIEFTFWANQTITFLSPIALDKALIWWERISLGLLGLGAILNCRTVRPRLFTLIFLLSWLATFLLLLIVYWNPKTLLPWGRFLVPAVAPMTLALVLGWQYLFPSSWRRPTSLCVTLSAGMVMIIGMLIPFVSLYLPFHPSRTWNARQVEHSVGTVYVESETGDRVAQLIGYNLPKSYVSPGTYFPVELCWDPLGQTATPYAVFIQLLDLGQLNEQNLPVAWGRRETYPGLGNRPTDRWTLHQPFCDRIFVWVFPETPAPLGAAVEVGFTEPNKGRLQPMDTEGDPVDLALVGRVPILSPHDLPAAQRLARYTLDDSISFVQLASDWSSSLTLTLTWQSIRSVSYDATTFVHVSDANGHIVAQMDRQPLDGRFPTSLWLPGQVVTDVLSLPLSSDAARSPLVLNVGMYTWPSMERLPIKSASGKTLPDSIITIDMLPGTPPALLR